MMLYVFSFLIVALGTSVRVPSLGILAASIGFLLFWQATLPLSRRRRFWTFVLWFFLVQMVQLSWMATLDYMGPLILLVYSGMSFLIALQFGLLSFLFTPRLTCLRDCFLLAGAFTLLEWSRLFICTGFLWNPIGLSLAASPLAIQFASLFGVYGLSFWVILVNALGFYLLHTQRTLLKLTLFTLAATAPYLFGYFQQAVIEKTVPFEHTVTAALVQTGILPEEKDPFPNKRDSFIHPLNQWERIWEGLDADASPDYIVLPEAAVSVSARRCVYTLEDVQESWKAFFGSNALSAFPVLQPPFAKMQVQNGQMTWKVSNAFIAQALSNHFHADVIAGFDDQENGRKYNAVFHFKPQSNHPERYEKQILVPIGEYVPLSFLPWISHFLMEQFGIGDSFAQGDASKVFATHIPSGISVCVEETYGELIRALRVQGARLLVNVTNDIWFPRSRLGLHHFEHAKIRSAENGVYALRSCNSGVTGVIDCFGSAVQTLPVDERNVQVLSCTIPLRSFSTLYTFWGDVAILAFSGLCVFVGLGARFLFRSRL